MKYCHNVQLLLTQQFSLLSKPDINPSPIFLIGTLIVFSDLPTALMYLFLAQGHRYILDTCNKYYYLRVSQLSVVLQSVNRLLFLYWVQIFFVLLLFLWQKRLAALFGGFCLFPLFTMCSFSYGLLKIWMEYYCCNCFQAQVFTWTSNSILALWC